MVDIIDVADYILNKTGEITSMKLQKLAYYSQAWSLAWDDMPLFDEDFEAWANGPVCVELYRRHKGYFMLPQTFLTPNEKKIFTPAQTETLDIVIHDYNQLSPQELSDLTHREHPWIQARRGTPPGMPCNNIIDKDVMRDYYSGLLQERG